ncbi:MAG: hypothetical protein M1831_005092 [Alyxoria varia]|nr:MAG: hypothetical protein M1831_005092 [Alyxoria varia]
MPFPTLFATSNGERASVQHHKSSEDGFGKWPLLKSFLLTITRLFALKAPDIYFEEIRIGDNLKGVWMIADPLEKPDVVVYYLHGGGFSMGSASFYVEFLMAWVTLLRDGVASGGHKNGDCRKTFRNPALFALDYSLVPTETFPTQLQETKKGYEYVLSTIDSSISPAMKPSRHSEEGNGPNSPPIVVSGDSAGATLVLSLLLRLAQDRTSTHQGKALPPPRLAALISPWSSLISPRNVDTSSDYLNANTLHLYAGQYLQRSNVPALKSTGGPYGVSLAEIASPGSLFDSNPQHLELWRAAFPTNGYYITHGAEEVFASETRRLVSTLKTSINTVADEEPEIAINKENKAEKNSHQASVTLKEKRAGIHAWPIVALFLGENAEDNLYESTKDNNYREQDGKRCSADTTGRLQRLEGVRDLARACLLGV